MRTISLLACLVLLLSTGCSGTLQNDVKSDKIWDIYTDLTFENDDSFIANMKAKHPAEQRMVVWLKDNNEQAYYDYMRLLKSQTFENGKQIILSPNCYYVQGNESSLTQKDVIQLYYDKKIEPMPSLSPHGAVTNFIESLANGSLGQAKLLAEGDFADNFSTIDKQNEFWKELVKDNLYARCIIKRVDMPNDLMSAKVTLELIMFTQQKSDGIEMIRKEKQYEIHLNKDGTWLIRKQS